MNYRCANCVQIMFPAHGKNLAWFVLRWELFPIHTFIVTVLGTAGTIFPWKVHKNENFFGFDFEFCTVPLLVKLKYEGFVRNNFWLAHYGGEVGLFHVVLRLRGMKIVFSPGQKNKKIKNHIWLLYIFGKNSFSKIRSINCDRDGIMCWSDETIGGIEFSLVWD